MQYGSALLRIELSDIRLWFGFTVQRKDFSGLRCDMTSIEGFATAAATVQRMERDTALLLPGRVCATCRKYCNTLKAQVCVLTVVLHHRNTRLFATLLDYTFQVGKADEQHGC